MGFLVHCAKKRGKMYYGSTKVEDLDYDDQPHEIEAREQEELFISPFD